MSHSYPGSELTVEQLVHALAQALSPNSPSRKELLKLDPQKILGLEQDLFEALQTTRSIRNARAAINKLPPEILSRVLEFRADEFVLVVATRVCRYWRSVMTSSPFLWTRFQFRMPKHDVDRTLTYLRRSKSAPIDIGVLSLHSPQDLEVFKYLTPHIARTRSLVIHGHHAEVRAASLLFCAPSPTLQLLEINSTRGLVRLPDDFLGQQAPSLSSVSFTGVYPAFESTLPLPSLIEFKLSLPEGADPFRVGALFRFFSRCPRLQKIYINSKDTTQDVTLDQVISLESLVELDYTGNLVGRIIPYLRLPRLKRLQVSSSFGSGQAQKLTDFLPHGGHVLLAGATEMLYYSDERTQRVRLSGDETLLSYISFRTTADRTPIDWFFDETCIPFGQIETLIVGGSVAMDSPINILVFKNLRIFQMIQWNRSFAEGILRLLHPHPGGEIPCRSLREIQYTCMGALRPLVNLVKERKRAGHQLGLVSLSVTYASDEDLVVELKEHVGEVQIRK